MMMDIPSRFYFLLAAVRLENIFVDYSESILPVVT
jgi:hypothetical protein